MSDPKPGSWRVQLFNSRPELPKLCFMPESGTASGIVRLTPFTVSLLEKVAWRAHCAAVPSSPQCHSICSLTGDKGREESMRAGRSRMLWRSLFVCCVYIASAVCPFAGITARGPQRTGQGDPGPEPRSYFYLRAGQEQGPPGPAHGIGY